MFDALLRDFKSQLYHFAKEVAPLNLQEDVLGCPVAGRYLGYKNADLIYPHRFNDPYLIGLCDIYAETKSESVLRRINEITNFLLYSQFKKDGHCDYLSNANSLWAGGFPDHNYDWTACGGYHWIDYEPHHHEDACAIYALSKSFEATGRDDILPACRLWVDRQYPRHGRFEGTYKGRDFMWQSYNPIAESIRPLAINNVQSLIAMALASSGFHLEDERLLQDALALLIYNAKDQFESGFWHYAGAEAEAMLKNRRSDDKTDGSFIYNVSYMQAQIWEMLNAISYLEQANVEMPAMLIDSLNAAESFLRKNGHLRRIAKTDEKSQDDGFKHKAGDTIKLYWVV